MVSGRSRFDHITDFVRDDLHWLPITRRVNFKVRSIVFKAINGLAPNYITDFIVRATVVHRRRDLRSSAALQAIPPSHRRQFAEHAFAVAGTMLWNTSPSNVRDATTLFAARRFLKVQLFTIAFRD